MAGFPITAPDLPRPVTFDQFWADLTFVQWPVRPEAVEHLYPPGTRPDVFDGMTYVGLIPFTMRHTAVGAALPLPYFGTFHETNVLMYSIDRTRRGLHSRMTVRIGADLEPTPLEVWLTARWGAHTRKAGRTWWVPNEHATWSFRSAEVLELDDELVAAAGVEPAGDRLRALFSAGVRARFGRPTRVK